MIPLSVLDQRVTIQRIGDGSSDDWNTPTEDVKGTDVYAGRLVPVPLVGLSEEILIGRDTSIVEMMLWLEPRAAPTSRDRAVIDGQVWELLGEPIMYRQGPLPHHLEAPVRRIVSG